VTALPRPIFFFGVPWGQPQPQGGGGVTVREHCYSSSYSQEAYGLNLNPAPRRTLHLEPRLSFVLLFQAWVNPREDILITATPLC